MSCTKVEFILLSKDLISFGCFKLYEIFSNFQLHAFFKNLTGSHCLNNQTILSIVIM